VLRYYDDESTPARGTELAERLIQQDGVRFLLGPYSSGLTKAILPIVEKHKVPMIEANGAARELFTKGYRYIFAVLSTSDQYLTPDAIAATQLDTFYGPVKFDEAGRNIAKPMVLTQVLHGKYVVVVPAKWATDKPVIPRPPH